MFEYPSSVAFILKQYLLSGETDLPEKRVCAGGDAPRTHPFFGILSIWLSCYRKHNFLGL